MTCCFFAVLIYTGNYRAGEAAKTILTDAVTDASDEIIAYGKEFVVDEKLKLYEDGVYISIYDTEGHMLEGKQPSELQNLPKLKDEAINKVKSDKGETWYIYDRLFEVEHKFVWVRGMMKDFTEQGTISFVLRLAIIGLPILVIIAAIGGFIITRRAFYPIRKMIETVEEIRKDGKLSRRIPISAEGASGDEISRLASNFNGMFDRLEASFEQEKRFTSDVSHELRTPLAVIISQSDYANEDVAYREHALTVIGREARRMNSLVNRLLTLSRSDYGTLTLETESVNLSDICHMLAEQQEVIAEDKAISIVRDIDDGIYVNGDEAMIIRILLNLMENAIKYGKQGGRVKISLRKENDEAVCSIDDDGIGISKENIERIWERFYRVEEARSEDGSGLGLAMVQALVKAHGGRVDVKSELNKGSCFTVFFPM